MGRIGNLARRATQDSTNTAPITTLAALAADAAASSGHPGLAHAASAAGAAYRVVETIVNPPGMSTRGRYPGEYATFDTDKDR